MAKLSQDFIKDKIRIADGRIIVDGVEYSDETFVWDDEIKRFGLRLKPSGSKSYLVQYRHGGKSWRKTLGKTDLLKAEAARLKARHLLLDVDNGINPIERERLEREKREDEERKKRDADQNTVAKVAARFVEEWCQKEGQRTWREVERIFRIYVNPVMGDRPIRSVTSKDIAELVNSVARDHGSAMGRQTLARVRKMFKWTRRVAFLIDTNPAADVDMPAKAVTGTRTLTDAELREVWAAAETLAYPEAHFVKVLLLSGRRRGSVAAMLRDEIITAHLLDPETSEETDEAITVWVPSHRSDNKDAPELPLSSALLALIDECLVDGKSYVFRGAKKQWHGPNMVTIADDTPIGNFTDIKDRLDEAIAAARKAAGISEPFPAWEMQRAIRRTVKTRLSELGVAKDVRDLIMGHAQPGMDKVYDHARRRRAKLTAMERWAAALQKIITRPHNVVSLGQKIAQ